MTRLNLKLLGYPEILLDGADVGETLVPYQKAFSLIIYIVMTGQPQSRLHLAELLWPETDERTALAYLRGRAGLTRIRDTLDGFFQIERHSVAFAGDADVHLDVAEFQSLLGGEAPLEQIEAAVALYRDDFCSGFLPDGVSAEFEMWLFGWRERLRQKQMAALEHLITVYSRWQEYERALHHAECLLHMDPWLEGTHRWLMSLYAWQGQPERALGQYETCRALLQEELGVEPAAETRRLHKEIVQRSLSPPPRVPFLAPAIPPHFVGRNALLTAVSDRLQPGACVALVGMGGIGKSTLAAAAAREVRYSFRDGILWANPLHTPAEEILLTWARFYDFDISGLASLEAMQTAWRGITQDRRILVVVDGVTTAEEVRPLLPHSPGCATLITTRNRDVATSLNAHPFTLTPIGRAAGRQLIEAILGMRGEEETETISAICRLLEGLPLALEILAQRLRSRPHQSLQGALERLEHIRLRLDMLEIEDRAVRTSFELSWEMLEPRLQTVFASLALFAGRQFHPDVVAALTGEVEADWLLADLAALSLVQNVHGDYYRQHALLADYAHEKLSTIALDKVELERRMASFYAGFVADYHADYSRLRQEWGNIQAVLQAAHRHGDWQQVYEVGRQMTRAWFMRARYAQARDAYRLSYDAARMLEEDEAIAQTLLDWARACIEQGDYLEADGHLKESLRLFQEFVGDPLRTADVRLAQGRLALEQSLLDDAENLLLEAQQVFERSGDSQRLARVNYRQAILAYRRNELDLARRMCEAAIEHLAGDDLLPALNLLSNILMMQAELEQAEQVLSQARALCDRLQNKASRAVVDFQLGRLHRRQEDFERATFHSSRGLEQFRKMGDRKSEAYALYDLSLIAEQQADYGRGLDLAHECLDIFARVDDQFNVMNTLLHLGDLYRAQQEDVQARSYWHRSLALAESLDNTRYVAGLQSRLESLT